MSTSSLTGFVPNGNRTLSIDADGVSYLRLPVKTRLITEKDNGSLIDLLKEYVAPYLVKGDIVFVSEKIVALTQGRIVHFDDVKPRALARFLARHVHTYYGTDKFRGYGHGTPIGMEVFIQEAGVVRVLVAAAVAAVTRPFGIKGLFYVISGKNAKSVDCPMSWDVEPYTHYAKRSPLNPNGVAKEIHSALGSEAAIVDANYIGAFSLGKSSRSISEKFIQAVLKDNPAGQADEMTPFFIIRKEVKS